MNPLFAEPATRTITTTQWNQLKNDKELNYKNDREGVVKPKPYKKSALVKFFETLFAFLGTSVGIFLMWGAVIIVVVFIIYKIFFSKDNILFSRNKRIATDTGPIGDEEDILSTNWEAHLQTAIDNNDLRLAVRYSYMWLLQMMQQQQLINYRSDKTNYEYYTELSNTNYKKPFRQLSLQYEFAWYGQFGMPQEMFNDYLTQFKNLKGQLGR
jgi:hypothetical protein